MCLIGLIATVNVVESVLSMHLCRRISRARFLACDSSFAQYCAGKMIGTSSRSWKLVAYDRHARRAAPPLRSDMDHQPHSPAANSHHVNQRASFVELPTPYQPASIVELQPPLQPASSLVDLQTSSQLASSLVELQTASRPASFTRRATASHLNQRPSLVALQTLISTQLPSLVEL